MNETLINLLITRHIDLMRYEKTVRADVFSLLEGMQNDISANILVGSLNRVERVITDGFALIQNVLDVLPVLDSETMWLAAALGGLVAAYGLKDKIKPLTQEKLKSLANQFTLGGLTLPETLAKQRDNLILRLKALVRSAKIDDVLPSMDDIADTFKRAKQTAQTMTKTWINSVKHTAHDAFGKINPFVKGYRHLSVLDSSTTVLCTHRNGLLWDKKHNPIGHAEIFKRPPLHPNCRSQIVYVYDLDEPFNGFTGSDWVQSRSLNQLQEQFGKGIGQMLFDGKIQLHEALDGLKPLTLKQLNSKLAQQQSRAHLSRSVFELLDVQNNIREMAIHFPRIQEFAKQHRLSETDYTALFLYTRMGKIVNMAVYNPEKVGRNLAVFQELNFAVNAALDKLPNYQGEVTRFVKFDRAFLGKHRIGEVVKYDTLTSASVAEVFSQYPVRITIQSKSGKLIEQVSALPQQREVLFRMGTQFKVLDYQEKDGKVWINLVEI